MPEPWTLFAEDDPDTVPPEGLRAEMVIYTGPGVPPGFAWHHIVGTVRHFPNPGFGPPLASINPHDGLPGSGTFTVLSPAADWPTAPPDAGRMCQWWRPLPVATVPVPSRGGR